MKSVVILTFIVILSSCAGPMTPFGSDIVNIFNDAKNDNEYIEHKRELASEVTNIKINFYPKMQNWHSNHDIFIHINSDNDIIYPQNIKLFWNNKNVSKTIINNSDIVVNDGNNLVLKLKNIRFKPSEDNQIFVYYNNLKYGQIYGQQYFRPQCNLNSKKEIMNTKPFKVKRSFVKFVDKESTKHNINPSLITALIAQESGFNYKAVSYAKAIGLTQVTNMASDHVTKVQDGWKSDKRLTRLPAPLIRAMIRFNKINKKHDWRLDKKKSVTGGIVYINYLEKYWRGNESLLKKVYGKDFNKEELLTELILSSYNSGPYRTKTMLLKHGKEWKTSKDLKEARKYINKIKSYCYHFSTVGRQYEKQTSHL